MTRSESISDALENAAEGSSNTFSHAKAYVTIPKAKLMNQSDSHNWYLDSGATDHICCSRLAFSYYESLPRDREIDVYMGDNSSVKAKGVGNVYLTTIGCEPGQRSEISLKRVLYVPDFCINLLCLSALQNFGYDIHAPSRQKHAVITDSYGNWRSSCIQEQNIYHLKTVNSGSKLRVDKRDRVRTLSA